MLCKYVSIVVWFSIPYIHAYNVSNHNIELHFSTESGRMLGGLFAKLDDFDDTVIFYMVQKYLLK